MFNLDDLDGDLMEIDFGGFGFPFGARDEYFF